MSAIKEYNDKSDMDFRSCMVGIVEAYDPLKFWATIRPAFNERIAADGGRIINYDPMKAILEVPVADIGGIRVIPEIGAHGILLFHDVDLQQYANTREAVNLDTARFHDYSDCIFLPFESANVGRPAPYMTIGCDFIQMHKDVQFDGAIQAKGNISSQGDIATSQYGLNDLGLNFTTHTHLVGTIPTTPTTSVLVPPVPPTPKVCPAVG